MVSSSSGIIFSNFFCVLVYCSFGWIFVDPPVFKTNGCMFLPPINFTNSFPVLIICRQFLIFSG